METATGMRSYRQRVAEIRKLNLTSDLLASVVFEDVMAVQDVLRILTGIRDLRVLRAEPQRSCRNLYGHSSVLDVWAEDSRNTQYNMEIQIAEDEEAARLLQFIKKTTDPKIPQDGFRNLAGWVEYLKDETGGAGGMCELLERERLEGRKKGMAEGRREGDLLRLISQTVKKRDRGMAVEDIADALEEEAVMIERILLAAAEAGSDEPGEIYACL